jgi:hypothetical protein
MTADPDDPPLGVPDKRRLLRELARALAAIDADPAVVWAAMRGDVIGDDLVVVIDADPPVMVAIPLWRLRRPDLDLVMAAWRRIVEANGTADWSPVGNPIVDDSDDELVVVRVNGVVQCTVHRSLCVRGWPK